MNITTLKMLFGFALLTITGALAAVIAIKHVDQQSSYGLPEILGGLLALNGGFANWAFGESRSSVPPLDSSRAQD